MLRIYKKNSEEIGDYTTSNNIMNFEDDVQSTDLYDYVDSYLQWNTSVIPGVNGNLGANRVNGNVKLIKLYSLGDNTPDVYPNNAVGSMRFTPYKPHCLVMNDKLQSTNYNVGIQGLLESNRKLNLMQHNLNTFTEDSEIHQSRDYYTGNPSLDLSQGASNATFPFSTLFKADGNTPSTYNASNVIVPLKEVLPSFGNKVLPSWIGNLKHTYTLENRKRVIGEVNPLSLCATTYSKVDFLRFNDGAVAAGDENKIVLTLPFSSLAELQKYTSTNLKPGDAGAGTPGSALALTWNVGGGALVNRRVQKAVIANNGIAFAGNVCTITFTANIFTAADAITNGKLHLNLINCANTNAGPAANVLTTVGQDFNNRINSPLYVGMGIRICYVDPLPGPATHNNVTRMITNLAAAAGNEITFTVDGNVIPINSTNIFIIYDGCYDGQDSDADAGAVPAVLGSYPTWKIDQAELVSWHLQNVTKQSTSPIAYDKYDLIPLNRPVTSQFQNTYTLPDSGVVRTVMLMNEISSDNNLIARDPTVGDYRLAFDNNPTTDKNVVANSPMYYDRIYKSLGGNIQNLLLDPQKNVIMETNNTANPVPLLDVQINATNGSALAANSILNLFVQSTAIIVPKEEPTLQN